MQHIPVNMRRLIKSTAQKAVYEIWKKQVKRQMSKCLLISSYTAFLFDIRVAREACHSLFFMKFMKCNIRALPFSILKIYKIGKEQVKDGRKRKILYRIERTNL